MNPAQLARMANRIGDFFRYQGDAAEAQRGIAAHLHHFWTPAMRRELVEWAERGDAPPEALDALVRAALAAHRDALLSPRARTRVAGEDALLERPPGGGDAG